MNYHSGCTAPVRIEDILKHEKDCEFKTVPCSNGPCNLTMAKCKLDEHLTVCPYTVIKCSCGMSLFRHQVGDLEAHDCRYSEHWEDGVSSSEEDDDNDEEEDVIVGVFCILLRV